jgi:hypothetical protein
VFNENGIPYSSASWEGVRDGCEDANYIKGARGMLEILEASGKKTLCVKFKERLSKIVESLDKDDAYSLRNAKVDLFTLLLDMKKTIPAVKPSLLWEDLHIVDQGTPKFALSATTQCKDAAESFAKLVEKKTGVAMKLIVSDGKGVKSNLIVFGHPDDNPILRALIADGCDLGVTSSYPAVDSYIIKEIDKNGAKIIAVIGKGKGLTLGMNNFYRFLKLNFDYPDQYFP